MNKIIYGIVTHSNSPYVPMHQLAKIFIKDNIVIAVYGKNGGTVLHPFQTCEYLEVEHII